MFQALHLKISRGSSTAERIQPTPGARVVCKTKKMSRMKAATVVAVVAAVVAAVEAAVAGLVAVAATVPTQPTAETVVTAVMQTMLTTTLLSTDAVADVVSTRPLSLMRAS